MTVEELMDALRLFPLAMDVKVACDKYVRSVEKVTTVVDVDTNSVSVEIVAEDKPSLAKLMRMREKQIEAANNDLDERMENCVHAIIKARKDEIADIINEELSRI